MASTQGDREARPLTGPPNHHYFGYYDKFPWDETGRYLACLETTFIDRPPAPGDTATVGLVDLAAGHTWTSLAETRAWNWQQGTMLHWLATAPDRLIIHNDWVDERLVSVIRDVHTGEARQLPRPVYTVSRNGRFAMTVNFARVHRHRPGYGYNGPIDAWADDPHPAEDGIYWMDLDTGENRLVVSIDQIVGIRHDETMDGASHWFNHLLWNTDDTRFLFLHRWRHPDRGWHTRLFTANPDGSDVCCVADHQLISHFDWRSPTEILAWGRQHGRGDHFYLFTDRTCEAAIVGETAMPQDGHSSYSPDRRWILNDTYPDATDRCRTLYLYREADGHRVDLGRFYAPPELDGEIRCDLHPRWSRDGTQVCFDSVHEGHRQVYVVDVADIVAADG